MLHIIEFIIGIALVGIALFDVFQSVVVPRWTGRLLRMSPWMIESAWPVWRDAAFRWVRDDDRENMLGTFAPFFTMLMLLAWIVSLVFGYGLALHGLGGQIPRLHGIGDAFYLAATSLFTVGFGDIVAEGGLARFVLLAAAACGLIVMALVISLTFSLHAAFQRREVQILTLDARAGTPPSGVAMLEAYAQYHMLDDLPATFAAWEGWAAEMLESHLAYPILPYFRSSHDNRSWISALGAVLDAATLLITTIQSGEVCHVRLQGASQMVYGLGCHTVTDLSHWFRFPMSTGRGDTELTRHIADAGVERGEFEDARRRLKRAGYELREAEEAWRDFVKYRAVYATSLNAMARHFASPPTQWIGDRSTLGHLHLRHDQDSVEAAQSRAAG